MAERQVNSAINIELREVGEHLRPASNQGVSYLDDGRQCVVTVCHDQRVTCDAERFDRPPRSAIAARLGISDGSLEFAKTWTGLEVVAKTTNVPVVSLLRQPFVPRNEIENTVLAESSVVVSWLTTSAAKDKT